MNILINLDKFKIVTLCGSTKFKTIFEKVNMTLTLQGKIILQPGCFAHFDKIVITDKQKKALDELHKEKILMSDCIYVINENNYIGDSTKTEIEFAMNNNIPIFYYNPI
jgi:hypothetical protein